MAAGGATRLIAWAMAMALVPAASAQSDDEGKNRATAAAEAEIEAPVESAPPPPPDQPPGDPKFEPVEDAKPAEAAGAPVGPLVPERVTGRIEDAPAAAPQAAAPLVAQRGLIEQDPKGPKPDLPDLPSAPTLPDTPYPECRDDYRVIEDAYRKADKTTECVDALDAWHAAVLVPHRQAMLDHQAAIAELYETEVQNNFNYSQVQRDEFFASVTAEHEAANLDGEHLASYREALARYEADRAYLRERFCRYAATCSDWAPSAESAERDAADARVAPTLAPGEETASARRSGRSRGSDDCGTERAGGGLLGGILGGVVGEATGLGALAGVLIGQAAGVLVADIACRLEPEEQEKAVEATEEVIERAEVGATAEWTSPTRADVSGSSTVTALNSQPSGASCIDITDIVIISGEETRVDKTMCRGPGESRYTLQA